MELDDVAAAMILLLLENPIDPLLSAVHPGCRKNGRFSNMRVIRANISRAIAFLFASTPTTCSPLNIAYHRR
ncbi:hypothetical protein [uncultured Mediterranean phage]|nr:hypothetical protein [uncultured Mediterranean phage]